MVEINKAFKRKLILRPEKAQECANYAGQNRKVYNLALEQRIMAYSLCRKSLNYYDQEKELKELKEAAPYLKQAPSQTLQQSLKDLQTAFGLSLENRGFDSSSRYALTF
jgi:putative transposase